MNKELNIIEAVNMPIGTEFEVFFKSGRKGTQKVIVSEELGSHKLIWEDGKDAVYKMICNGRYGTYDGQWIDLNGEHYDERTHNCGKCNLHINE